MKPGDKVFHVDGRAGEYPYIGSIRVGVFVERTNVETRWPKVRVHFGWIAAEDVDPDSVFATKGEAEARLVALVKKHLARIRAEARRLAKFDLAGVKVQDRTGQIKKRDLAKIGGGQ